MVSYNLMTKLKVVIKICTKISFFLYQQLKSEDMNLEKGKYRLADNTEECD